MTETKTMEWFGQTVDSLASRQNEKRDVVLELIVSGKYDEAKKSLDELQTISLGIQLCQQSLMRDQDRLQSEANKNAAKLAVAPPPPVQMPKKKGWFSK